MADALSIALAAWHYFVWFILAPFVVVVIAGVVIDTLFQKHQ